MISSVRQCTCRGFPWDYTLATVFYNVNILVYIYIYTGDCMPEHKQIAREGRIMSNSKAYEYRAFLLQIAEKLSQDDSKKIAYLEGLPPDMESKPAPLTFLMQLEMRGRVSASRPDDLAKILEEIERHDLAKKVKDFAGEAAEKGKTNSAK